MILKIYLINKAIFFYSVQMSYLGGLDTFITQFYAAYYPSLRFYLFVVLALEKMNDFVSLFGDLLSLY